MYYKTRFIRNLMRIRNKVNCWDALFLSSSEMTTWKNYANRKETAVKYLRAEVLSAYRAKVMTWSTRANASIYSPTLYSEMRLVTKSQQQIISNIKKTLWVYCAAGRENQPIWAWRCLTTRVFDDFRDKRAAKQSKSAFNPSYH